MNTNEKTTTTTETDAELELRTKLSAQLDRLRPIFNSEGGEARIVGLAEGVARITFDGGCEGCGGGIMAMAPGLRLMLLEKVPGLKDVVFE